MVQSSPGKRGPHFSIVATALALGLAGCSGGSSSLSPSVGGSTAASSFAHSGPIGPLSGLLDPAAAPKQKIFIVERDVNTLVTYTTDGKPSTPTITGLSTPVGVAVDANGKIYVANSGSASTPGTITTYNPDGSQTTPTITVGLAPFGVAVDGNGKIYVANYDSGTVTTYLPDGTPTTPTIGGLLSPTDVKVDSNGKIYVTQKGTSSFNGSVTTYNPDGSQTKPTITAGIYLPASLALDAKGNIYVSNDATDDITTYAPNGKQRKVTMSGFTTGDPGYIAIGATGKVYVTSSHGFMTTYTKSGKPSKPTISSLTPPPLGIAIH
jgi:serine/threonine-protein kinase